MSALAQQVEAFTAKLAEIRAEHGSVWAVFLDGSVRASFPTFEQAAMFAFESLGDADYLIRHTYPEPEFIPFLLTE